MDSRVTHISLWIFMQSGCTRTISRKKRVELVEFVIEAADGIRNEMKYI
jgi:hypothetical protein